MSKNTEKTTKKLTYQCNSCQFIAVVLFCWQNVQIKGKPALEYFLTREKSHG